MPRMKKKGAYKIYANLEFEMQILKGLKSKFLWLVFFLQNCPLFFFFFFSLLRMHNHSVRKLWRIRHGAFRVLCLQNWKCCLGKYLTCFKQEPVLSADEKYTLNYDGRDWQHTWCSYTKKTSVLKLKNIPELLLIEKVK